MSMGAHTLQTLVPEKGIPFVQAMLITLIHNVYDDQVMARLLQVVTGRSGETQTIMAPEK